jgi:hypothetical protein
MDLLGVVALCIMARSKYWQRLHLKVALSSRNQFLLSMVAI